MNKIGTCYESVKSGEKGKGKGEENLCILVAYYCIVQYCNAEERREKGEIYEDFGHSRESSVLRFFSRWLLFSS